MIDHKLINEIMEATRTAYATPSDPEEVRLLKEVDSLTRITCRALDKGKATVADNARFVLLEQVERLSAL